MKRYLYMTFAVLGLLGSTVPHAEAGNLTGVRVSNHEGTSRIVLDVSECLYLGLNPIMKKHMLLH